MIIRSPKEVIFSRRLAKEPETKAVIGETDFRGEEIFTDSGSLPTTIVPDSVENSRMFTD